jgi:hypothetical protein
VNRTFSAAVVLAFASGCGAAVSPPAISSSHSEVQGVSRATVPDACQATSAPLNSSGGTLPFPACGRWSGTLAYPPPIPCFRHCKPNAPIVLQASETNLFGAPSPPPGEKVLLSLRFRRKALTEFNCGYNVENSVTDPSLSPSRTYSLYVYNINGPCPPSNAPTRLPGPIPPTKAQPDWAVYLGSPNRGTHTLTFYSPFNGSVCCEGWNDPAIWQFVQN